MGCVRLVMLRVILPSLLRNPWHGAHYSMTKVAATNESLFVLRGVVDIAVISYRILARRFSNGGNEFMASYTGVWISLNKSS
jgi:hypothetical protein